MIAASPNDPPNVTVIGARGPKTPSVAQDETVRRQCPFGGQTRLPFIGATMLAAAV